jgi:hypothetical protein
MVGVLAGLTFVMGPMQMLKLYAIPYLVILMFLLLQAHFLQNDNFDWCVVNLCG